MRLKFGTDKIFLIERDEYQYTLSKVLTRKKGNKVGTTYQEVIGYYPKEQELLKALLRHEVSMDAVETIEQLNNAFNDFSDRFAEQLAEALDKEMT